MVAIERRQAMDEQDPFVISRPSLDVFNVLHPTLFEPG
jgi:hypothetical protein